MNLTRRQQVLCRWPSAKCVKLFGGNLFAINTGPAGRGVTVPRSKWRATRALAWEEAADNARRKK